MVLSNQSRPTLRPVVRLPNLPYPTCDATACVLNGRFYVIGGEGILAMQVLEMTENGFSWTVKDGLPAERIDPDVVAHYSAASAVVNGKLWVIGGSVSVEEEGEDRAEEWYTEAVDIYDSDLGTWQTGPELPRGVLECKAITHAGEIHLFDDCDGKCIIYRNGEWEEEADEPHYRKPFAYRAVRQSLILG